MPDCSAFDSELLDAVKQLDFETVARLIRDGANPNARDGDYRTALATAAAKGSIRIAGLLLDAGAAIEEGSRFKTPYEIAKKRGLDAMAEYLAERGADTNPPPISLPPDPVQHELRRRRWAVRLGLCPDQLPPAGTFPPDWLSSRIDSQEEIERLSQMGPYISDFMAKMRPGDELWFWEVPREQWAGNCWRYGYVIIRDNTTVADLPLIIV